MPASSRVYGSTFGNVDPTAISWRQACSARRSASIAKPGACSALLWSHDVSAPIGTWSDIREDRIGLRMKGRLSLDTVRGAEARALAMDRALGLSIGLPHP